MINNAVAIGADIGGSHITAAVVDVKRLQIVSSSPVRKSISTSAGADELIVAWAASVATAAAGSAIEKLCIAMPGPFIYEEGICLIKDQDKYPGLFNVNVKQRLAEALLIDPSKIYLQNDAACFMQGEVCCGSLMGFNTAIGVTLGTGLGTAVYSDQAASSADLWNMSFHDSIAEDYLSSRWFVAEYFKQTGYLVAGVKELASLAHTDEKARTIFDNFGVNLSEFINRFISITRPEALVIGGNISHAFPFFGERLLSEVSKVNPAVKIFKSVLGEDAALVGAVSSWLPTAKRSMAD